MILELVDVSKAECSSLVHPSRAVELIDFNAFKFVPLLFRPLLRVVRCAAGDFHPLLLRRVKIGWSGSISSKVPLS